MTTPTHAVRVELALVTKRHVQYVASVRGSAIARFLDVRVALTPAGKRHVHNVTHLSKGAMARVLDVRVVNDYPCTRFIKTILN